MPLIMSVRRLERPVVAAQHRPAAPAVVQQRIHRLLEHSLLVADDDFRRVEVDQLLETVVPVDDAPVEVVQIARGEVVPLQQDQRPQIRRNHRDRLQDHPFRLVVAVLDLVDGLEPLGQVLDLLLAVGLGDGLAQVARRGRPGPGSPAATLIASAPMAALNELPYLVLASRYSSSLSSWPAFRPACARIGDHVILEIDDLLEVRALHPQDRAQPVGDRLEEPDVQHRRGQIDVAHALAPHPAVGHLDAATVADDPLELRALVLAARAFPVALRSEDPLAEQTVLFRPIGPVVDRLGLADLAKGPAPNVIRAGQVRS